MYRLQSGQRFQRFTTIAHDPQSERCEPKWICRCDCGTVKSVRVSLLCRGIIQSCGCLRSEKTGDRNRTHGASGTPEHKIWLGMKKRCYQITSTTYSRYGGRGISMCERWRDSFENFYADMGPRPSPNHSIERGNNDGPYSPDNCRWATRAEQAHNKRNNHNLTFRGETKPLSVWARIVGLPRLCVRSRIVTLGWDTDRALTTPRQSGDHSMRQTAARHGLKRTTVEARLKRGWTLDRALNTPV